MSFDPPRGDVRDVVERALTEDLTPLGDLTSSLLDPEIDATADFVAREAGVLAGTACAAESFAQVDDRVVLEFSCADGTVLAPGTRIGAVHGRLASILTAERTALNFMGHLSGIATVTARYVAAAAAGGAARVWDTRKTTPGLRSLEKAAVRAGGAHNHRGSLSDWILLKDNHIAGIGITEAVERAASRWPGRTVHIECDRLDQMVEAINAGADAVLLDNMSPHDVAACVAEADRLAASGRACLIEVSGGITLETIGQFSAAGAHMISVGRITNSAPTLDIGLDIETGETGARV